MQLLLMTKRNFTIALWMPVRQSANTLASFKGRVGPWWDVSRRTLNLTENILSPYINCILSAVTHKLNVFGHMLTRTFSPVLVRGSRAQSLSEPFSYTKLVTSSLLLWNTLRPAECLLTLLRCSSYISTLDLLESSFGLATDSGLDGRGSIPGRSKRFFSTP
jgi:hypothetical protein